MRCTSLLPALSHMMCAQATRPAPFASTPLCRTTTLMQPPPHRLVLQHTHAVIVYDNQAKDLSLITPSADGLPTDPSKLIPMGFTNIYRGENLRTWVAMGKGAQMTVIPMPSVSGTVASSV